MDASETTDAAISQVTTEVATDRGPVHGVSDGDLVRFTGIPYAKANRWEPPVPADSWTTPLDATELGPACPQGGHPTLPQNENCLFINVWAHATGGSRPVIVWIHGGGYIEGSAREAVYDGAAFARATGATIVSFDYRLGVLGFLALPQLTAADGGIGNYGIRDQIAALQWVQRNASAFNGDPARVMIAGESAGGASTCTLLAAPSAQGLFAAASIQSGPCGLVLDKTAMTGTMPSAQGYGAVAVAVPLGCTSGDIAACLRSKSTEQILSLALPAYYDYGFGVLGTLPVVDGVILDMRPLAALAAGRGSVPIIVGSNRDDASAFVVGMGVASAAGSFGQYLQFLEQKGALSQAQRAALLTLYSPSSLGGEVAAATAFATDAAFACVAQQVVAARTSPTYLYELAQPVSNGPLAVYGAVHGYDFVNLFASFSEWGVVASASDTAVSADMQAAWSAIAHHEAPSEWPLATAATSAFRTFHKPALTSTTWRNGRCAQLAELGLLQR